MPSPHRSVLRRAALTALEHGWSVLPLNHKFPHGVLKRTGHSKLQEGQLKPSWKALQSTPPSPQDLEVWLSDRSVTGIGVITGAISALWVLDIDVHPEALQLMRDLRLEPQVCTPSGGFHLYLPWSGEKLPTLNSKTQKLLPHGIDTRGDGGYAVLPPSVNARGSYRQLRPITPTHLAALRDLNAGLLERIMPKAPPPPPPPAAILQHTRESTLLSYALERSVHGRNNAGFWLANRLRDKGLSHAEALAVMLTYQQAVHCQATGPYTAQEAHSSLNSAYSR